MSIGTCITGVKMFWQARQFIKVLVSISIKIFMYFQVVEQITTKKVGFEVPELSVGTVPRD